MGIKCIGYKVKKKLNPFSENQFELYELAVSLSYFVVW